MNSLRGYPIVGKPLQIPATHIGMVFQEDKQPLDENADRTFRQTCRFQQFTYWNYDQLPSANDSLKKAVEGFCISEEVNFYKLIKTYQYCIFIITNVNTIDCSSNTLWIRTSWVCLSVNKYYPMKTKRQHLRPRRPKNNLTPTILCEPTALPSRPANLIQRSAPEPSRRPNNPDLRHSSTCIWQE